MHDPEKVATIVSEWIAKAKNDLKAAEIGSNFFASGL
jgi:hypothetical protein